MKIIFTTIASKYRLYQCVAMYHSLQHFIPEVPLVVLALDLETKRVLDTMKLPEMTVIYIEELEDAKLKEIRVERDLSEYCWTLKPVLLLHLVDRFKDCNIFTYLDSDLFFFDNPMGLLKYRRNWSVLLTTHKVNRKANGGFVAFRRSRSIYAILEWWKDSCLEWCYSCYHNGKFADQGYLDYLRLRFKGVYYLEAPGANVAPWNSFKYDFTLKNEEVYVNRNRLVFYHFSGLRLKRDGNSAAIYGVELPCEVCGIYSKALRNAIKEIEEVDMKVCEYFYMGI